MSQLAGEQQELYGIVERRFAQSMRIPEAFFAAEAERIAQACWAMARRFHQGGRLLAFGNGAWATDAQHVSVEFVHPVIVGKRALPALALTNDSATISGLMAGRRGDSSEMPFAHQLRILARPQDMALGFSLDGNCATIVAALNEAQRMGLLSLALTGGDGGELARRQAAVPKDDRGDTTAFCFIVPTDDALVVQETHETLYHILWELVHIFFEHEGVLV